MRIAVDDAEAAERKPPRREHGPRQRVAGGERVVLVREHPRAVEPIERQEPPGRQIRPGARHTHGIGAVQHGAIERDVLGLAKIVELLAHARADLLGDLGGVDRAVETAADGEQPLQLPQIGFDRRLYVGILQLAGQTLAV
jgi:hypothetical protein